MGLLEKYTTDELMQLMFQFFDLLDIGETPALTIANYLGLNIENLETMLLSMLKRYDEKGTISEEELLKVTIMITCKK